MKNELTSKTKKSGFTIIELVVVMAIASILIAVAVPGFRSIVSSNQTAIVANEFLSAMVLARSESIKRGYPVVVCTSNEPGAANAVCDTGNDDDWDDGWLVFPDKNNNGVIDYVVGDPELDESPLLVHDALPEGYTLKGQIAAPNQLKHSITYEASGFARQQGQVVVCNKQVVDFSVDKIYARALCLHGSGRARIVDSTNSEFTVTSCTPA